MCGLFGFVNYGDKDIKGLTDLTNSLAEQASVRGTDATGISYVSSGVIRIVKEDKPAYKIAFKHPDNVKSLIGHTRHSTQGSEKRNYNNHPFYGKTRNASFSLAHNGILYNDDDLRKKYKLPKTKIETDSYISVQLIESRKKVCFDSIKYMAEKVEGSFSFSILDDRNNLYLVKGDSPVSILHFAKQKLYVYASTDEILFKALVDSPLFKNLKNGEYEEIKITEGDILKIDGNGVISKDTFKYSCYYGRNWWDFGSFYKEDTENSYLDDLKSIARYQGYAPETIDMMIDEGFSLEEIEEYIYCLTGEY